MAEAIGLGASIVGIAAAGVTAANALVRFAISYRGALAKFEDFASRISLSATILEEVGNTITENEQYFKRNEFETKFGRVLGRCKADYETLRDAISKAGLGAVERDRWVADESSVAGRTVKKVSAWNKLAWALGGEEVFKDLQQSFRESTAQVLMMQSAAQMIVLQIIGHKNHGLTASEQEQLGMLRRDVGILVGSLRNAGIISIVSVSPHQPDQPEIVKSFPGKEKATERQNVSMEEQQEARSNRVSDVSKLATSVAADQETSDTPLVSRDPVKLPPEAHPNLQSFVQEASEADRRNCDITSLKTKEIAKDPSSKPEALLPDFYEAWIVHPPQYESKEKEIRVLGITVKVVERIITDRSFLCHGVSISQDEIRDLLSVHAPRGPISVQPSRAWPSAVEWFLNKPDHVSRAVSWLILNRHRATKFDFTPRSWTLVLLVDIPNKASSTGWRSRTSSALETSYLAILRCLAVKSKSTIPATADQRNDIIIENRIRPLRDGIVRLVDDEKEYEFLRKARTRVRARSQIRGRRSTRTVSSSPRIISYGPPPPPRAWTSSKTRAGVFISEKNEELFMSQENAEALVNDALASFSTLYDEIPEKNRRDVLESVPIPEVVEDGDAGSSEDSSSSDSWDSLADN